MLRLKIKQLSGFAPEILAVILLIIAILSQGRVLPQGLYLGFLLMPLIFLVPGLLLLEILSRQQQFNFIQKFAISFGLSLGIGVLPTFIAFGFKLSSTQFSWLYLGLIIVLLILAIIFKWRRKSFLNKPSLFSIIKSRFQKHPLVFIWGAGGTLGFLLVYIFQKFHYKFLHLDNWVYLSFLKRFVEQPFLSATDPVIGSQNVAISYSYNVYLNFQVLLSKISGVALADLSQFVLPIGLMFISLAVFYLLGRSLIKNFTVFTITFILFLGYLSTIRCQYFFIHLSEVKFAIFFAAIPLIFYLVIQFLKKPKTFWLIILGLSFLGIANAHISLAFIVVLIAVLLVGLNLILNWKKRSRNWMIIKKLLIFSLIFLIFFIPAFLYQNYGAFSGGSIQSRVFEETSNDDYYLSIKGHQFYILNPRLLFSYPHGHAHGELGPLHYLKILTLVLALSFIPKLKKRIAYQYLFIATAIPILLIFTPGIAGLVGKFYPIKVAYRFTWFIPEVLVLGAFVNGGLVFLKKIPRFLKRTVLWVTLIVVGGAVFYGTVFFERYALNEDYDTVRTQRKEYGYYAYKGYPKIKMLYPDQDMQLVIDYLNNNSDYSERVMMSSLDSLVFVPNISNYVVASFQWNITGYFMGDMDEGKRREKDLRDFFITKKNSKIQNEILERYHPVWIISQAKIKVEGLDLRVREGRYYLYKID